MIFSEAMNTQAYLKAGIMGFAGSGKTFTAKEIAVGLWKMLRERELPGGKAPLFFLDTETGSDWIAKAIRAQGISLFAAKTRAFKDLIPAIREAEAVNGIIIIDSITHFWRELTETYAEQRNRKRGLEFQDWAYLKKTWGEFTDAFINSNCHIIMCGRAGYEYDFFQNEDGKKELEKTGIKMKAETETGYEPSILILMEREQDIGTDPITVWRTATVLKDRADLLDGKQFKNPTFDDFRPHIDFLNLGGKQLGVDTAQNSADLIEPIDNSYRNEMREREIVLDEIKELLIKHYPSSGAADKKAKGNALESTAGTRSWERLSTYLLVDLKNTHAKLKDLLPKEREPGEELPTFAHQDPVEA